MKQFGMIRNGKDMFVFKEASNGNWIEYYQRWEEDPESPEGAYGEWKVIHTVSFLREEVVKLFSAKLAAIGFTYF